MARPTASAHLLAILLPLLGAPAYAAQPVALPPPRLDGGAPLMQALSRRASSRAFSGRALPRQVLADLLWAADGVNRPASGMRTAPSAHNRQEVDIYVAMADGLYRYDAKGQALIPVTRKDIRALTGRQRFPAHAPLNLVYVVNFARTPGVPRAAAIEAGAVSTGAVVQNVYLYCASAGLATVVRGWVDKPALAKAMGLGPRQYIVVAQTVVYAAKSTRREGAKCASLFA
ncbi:MAG: SagB/ThcOx family dehydrogenase, partial [Pseudolabrys sp.]